MTTKKLSKIEMLKAYLLLSDSNNIINNSKKNKMDFKKNYRLYDCFTKDELIRILFSIIIAVEQSEMDYYE